LVRETKVSPAGASYRLTVVVMLCVKARLSSFTYLLALGAPLLAGARGTGHHDLYQRNLTWHLGCSLDFEDGQSGNLSCGWSRTDPDTTSSPPASKSGSGGDSSRDLETPTTSFGDKVFFAVVVVFLLLSTASICCVPKELQESLAEALADGPA